MNLEALTLWLKRKKAGGIALNLSAGIVGFVAGLVVLFFTFWFTYAVIWFGWYGVSAVSELIFSKRLHLSHGWRLTVSGVFMALLFIQHFRTSKWYWGTYPNDDYVAAPGLQARAGVMGALAFMLACPGASANMLADILLSGPRLVTGSVRLAAQGFQWRQVDENRCAELLAYLQTRTNAVPYEDLETAGWNEWTGQLRFIDGVNFLQKGLTLSEDLRNELNDLEVNYTHAPLRSHH